MSLKPTVKEAREIRFRQTILAFTTLLTLGVGTVIFKHLEDLSWIDSLYYCVVSLTTVGYGDITPKTDAGKLFSVIY